MGRTLGCTKLTAFCTVTLPLAKNGLIAAAILTWARAIGEFGSVAVISGNIPYKTQMASVYIYGQVEADAPGAAAAVSVVLLAASLGLLAVFDLLRRRISRHAEPVA